MQCDCKFCINHLPHTMTVVDGKSVIYPKEFSPSKLKLTFESHIKFKCWETLWPKFIQCTHSTVLS